MKCFHFLSSKWSWSSIFNTVHVKTTHRSMTPNWCLCWTLSAGLKCFKRLLQKSTKWIFSWFLGLKEASLESAGSDVSCKTRPVFHLVTEAKESVMICAQRSLLPLINRLRTCCRSTTAGQQRRPRDTDTGNDSPDGGGRAQSGQSYLHFLLMTGWFSNDCFNPQMS